MLNRGSASSCSCAFIAVIECVCLNGGCLACPIAFSAVRDCVFVCAYDLRAFGVLSLIE